MISHLMASSETTPPWRFWSDLIAAALGVNLWVSLVLVPGLFVGAFRTPGAALLASVPLLPLGLGLVRRSSVWLLTGYPAALLLPIAYAPRIVAGNLEKPLPFALVALSLVAYLFGVSFFSAFHDPPPPEAVRRLPGAGQPTPPRWRRRFRLYAALAILSAIFPAVLLHAVNFDEANRAYLRQLYPGRAGAMTALMNVGVLGVWLVLYQVHFVGLLKQHRTGDRELQRDLDRLRRDARRSAPRPSFYVAVTSALLFMGLLVFLRYR